MSGEVTQQVDHRAEALTYLDAAWARAEQSNGTDPAIPIQLQSAQIHSNLAIADELRRTREALGGTPRGVENGDLARWILDALEQPADDPSCPDAAVIQSRIENAIKGWFDGD